MRPAARVLAAPPGFPGFWTRSLDEFKRLSNIALNLDGIKAPKNSLEIWNFSEPGSVKACTAMSDSDIGGFSSANLEYVSQSASSIPHARFHGHISTELPLGDTEIERTGYAAWRTKERPRTVFGKSLWDVDRFRYLALQVKSDGRKYKVNVQTESVVYTDIHQHRLYTRRPNGWETVFIKWSDFVRTNHGIVVEPQSEIMKEKIRTIGVGLTDRLPGPFELCIAQVWATNIVDAVNAEQTDPFLLKS